MKSKAEKEIDYDVHILELQNIVMQIKVMMFLLMNWK